MRIIKTREMENITKDPLNEGVLQGRDLIAVYDQK
jgi:hypothetical protein